MSTPDLLLIAPTQQELAAAVSEAIDAVNRGQAHDDRLRCSPEELAQVWLQVRARPEGSYLWRCSARGWRYSVRTALAAVWWSDHLGRPHVRLTGRTPGDDGTPLPLPGPDRPALACIYPGRCVLISQDRRSRLRVVCGCGSWGEPGELAWMGRCCGPCHDREEAAPDLGWRLSGPVQALSLSAAGDRVLCLAGGRDLHLRDLLAGHGDDWQAQFALDTARLSADGHLLLTGSGPRQFLSLWKVAPDADGDNLRLDIPGYLAAFTLDGTGVILDVTGAGLVQWRFGADQAHVRYAQPFPIHLYDLVVSPDGRLVAGAAGAHGLFLWEVYTGRLFRRIELANCYGPLAFSPDGTALAAGAHAAYTKGALYDLQRDRTRGTVGGTAALFDLTFSPDGAWLVVCDAEGLTVHDARSGLQRRTLSRPGYAQDILSLRVTPDGRFAVVGLGSGEVRLWPAEMLWPD